MFVLIFNPHSFIICVSWLFKWYSQYSQMYGYNGYSWPLKIGNNWLCRRTVWHAETNWDEFTFKSKIELVWKNCNKSYEIIWFASAVGGRSMNDYSPGKLNRKVILTEWRFGATIYVYFMSLNTYFLGLHWRISRVYTYLLPFQKTQVAFYKNAHNFWCHFLAQYAHIMPFQMVWSVLFQVCQLCFEPQKLLFDFIVY